MKAMVLTAYIPLVSVIVLVVLSGQRASALPASGTAPAPAAINCASVSGIPPVECEALLALYNSTGGPSWTVNTGWNVTNTPCSWYGVMCGSGRVVKLDLSDNRLLGAIPPQLANLAGLREFYLSFNQLSGPIPPELSNLSNLNSLDVSANQLTGAIPPGLSNLSRLKILDLSSNLLTGTIPATLGNLAKLEFLILGSNQLSGTVPPQLGGLTNLLSLTLSDNLLLSGALPHGLSGLSLELFFFSYTNLCEPPDTGFQDWLAAFYPDFLGEPASCAQRSQPKS